MKTKIVKALIVAVGAAGMIAPRAMAAEPQVSSIQSTRPVDVALTHNKLLHGQVVTAENAPQAGMPVNVISRGEIVAQTTTDARGAFQAPVSRGGVYVVEAGGSERVVRTWTEETAPPSASDGVLVVTDESAVRGQGGGWISQNIIPLGLIGGFAGFIVAEATNNDEPPRGS
jgi:hypothetical protein